MILPMVNGPTFLTMAVLGGYIHWFLVIDPHWSPISPHWCHYFPTWWFLKWWSPKTHRFQYSNGRILGWLVGTMGYPMTLNTTSWTLPFRHGTRQSSPKILVVVGRWTRNLPVSPQIRQFFTGKIDVFYPLDRYGTSIFPHEIQK